jgi:hypothetical protein
MSRRVSSSSYHSVQPAAAGLPPILTSRVRNRKKKHASRARIDLLPRARRAHHHQNGIHRPRRGLAFSITGVLPLVVPPARATFYCLTAANNVRLPVTSLEPRTTIPQRREMRRDWSRTKPLPRIRSRTDSKHMQQAEAGARAGCATDTGARRS